MANAAAAGMVSVGKLNMTELAYSGLGLNPHFGTPLNPNDRKTPRSPGGSSSGCGRRRGGAASALRHRLRHRRLGAHSRGLQRCRRLQDKHRPDRHYRRLIPLARSYDTIGPLARSVEDCILLDMAMRGAVTTPVRRGDLLALTLIVPRNVVLDDAERCRGRKFRAIA